MVQTFDLDLCHTPIVNERYPVRRLACDPPNFRQHEVLSREDSSAAAGAGSVAQDFENILSSYWVSLGKF